MRNAQRATTTGRLLSAVGLLACALWCLFPQLPVFSQDRIRLGFAVLETTGGGLRGTALFSFHDSEGTLIWEAGVPACRPTLSGTLFVQRSETIRTAVAMVNASDQPTVASFALRDTQGRLVERSQARFEPGTRQALYVDQLFDDPPRPFVGTLEFESSGDHPLAAITLRENLNRHAQPIFATLPVFVAAAGPDRPDAANPVVLPHLGAGYGFSTMITLVNTSHDPLDGSVSLFKPDGSPWLIELEGESGAQFAFALPPLGSRVFQLSSPGAPQAGYAVIRQTAGRPAPAAAAIFQFQGPQGEVITEAGVPDSPSDRRFLIYVDNHMTRTGLAVASPGNQAQTLHFRLLDRFGQFLAETGRPIAAEGQMAAFADELFPELPQSFSGLMEVSAVAGLRPVPEVELQPEAGTGPDNPAGRG